MSLSFGTDSTANSLTSQLYFSLSCPYVFRRARVSRNYIFKIRADKCHIWLFLEGLRITVSNMDALTDHSNISTCQDASHSIYALRIYSQRCGLQFLAGNVHVLE